MMFFRVISYQKKLIKRSWKKVGITTSLFYPGKRHQSADKDFHSVPLRNGVSYLIIRDLFFLHFGFVPSHDERGWLDVFETNILQIWRNYGEYKNTNNLAIHGYAVLHVNIITYNWFKILKIFASACMDLTELTGMWPVVKLQISSLEDIKK